MERLANRLYAAQVAVRNKFPSMQDEQVIMNVALGLLQADELSLDLEVVAAEVASVGTE